MHVVFGILWIGLLYYFNFVQTRKMPEIPAELRPALSKYITPEALFWFRWSALMTVLAGFGIAGLHGSTYFAKVFTLGFAGGYDGSPNSPDRGYDPDGQWHLPGPHHVPQRMGNHLAQPEDCPWHQGRPTRTPRPRPGGSLR